MSYYEILNLNNNATEIEIKLTYRKLSLHYYPKKSFNVDDENLFNKITQAFYVLSDSSRRKIYDMYGYNGLLDNNIFVFDIDCNAIYMKECQNNMQQITTSKENTILLNNNIIELDEMVTLQEVYNGKYVDKKIKRKSLCNKCNGTGSDDGIMRRCRKCQGRRVLINLISNIASTETCPVCNGIGINTKIHCCQICNGLRVTEEEHVIKFLIPVGIENDEIIQVKNEGNIILGNNKRDDVNVRIKIMYNDVYSKHDTGKYDLFTTIHIPLVDALCGVSRILVLPNGKKTKLFIDTVIKHSDIYVMENCGLPQKNNREICGKLYIELKVDYPEQLNETVKKEIYRLLSEYSNNTNFEMKDVQSIVKI